MAFSLFTEFATRLLIVLTFCVCCSVTVRDNQNSETSPDTSETLSWTFYHAPVNLTLFKAENVTINCTTSDPSDHLVLSHKYVMFEEYDMVPDGKRIQQYRQVFLLRNLSYHDNGLYICSAINGDRKLVMRPFMANISVVATTPKAISSTSLEHDYETAEEPTLTTKVKNSKPYIYFNERSPVFISINVAERVKLTATAKGLQPIKMFWTKDGHNLKMSEKFRLLNKDRQLVIKPPFVKEYSGTYSVMACNLRGCQVRGIQVLFYESNFAKVSMQKGFSSGGPVVVLQKVAIISAAPLVIILGLVLVLLMKTKKIPRKFAAIKELGKEIKRQKERGGGRSASLWNWNSGEDLSVDELSKHEATKTRSHTMPIPHKDTARKIKRQYCDSDDESIDDIVLSCENIIQQFKSQLHSGHKPKKSPAMELSYSEESD